MINKQIVTAGVVGGLLTSLVFTWKASEGIKNRILNKLTGKNEFESLDLNIIARVAILITIMAIVWMPIFYILSMIYD